MVMICLDEIRSQSAVRITVILLWVFSFIYHILYMNLDESLQSVIYYFKPKNNSQQREHIYKNIGILGQDNVSLLINIMDETVRQGDDNLNALFSTNGILGDQIPLKNPKDKNPERPPWMRLDTSYRETIILRSVVYYDDRPLVTDVPCLRLYILYSCAFNADFWQYFRFRLVTSHDNWTYDITKFSLSETDFAVNWTISHTNYCQNLVTLTLDLDIAAIITHLQESDITSYLLVTFQKEEFLSTIEWLKIVYSDSNNPVDFAVCVKPLFGKLSNEDISFLLEWFELYSAFGVSNFYIYNTTLMPENENLHRVLNYYKKYRSLRLIQFGDGSLFPEYVKTNLNEFNMANLVARAAYMDCIYMNYKRVKYMIQVDPDEIIVPRMHLKYKNLFEHLQNSTEHFSNYASVYARMTMFFKLTPIINETFQTLQYQNRTHVPVFVNRFGQTLRNKPFINTQICILTFQHHCIMAPEGFPMKMEIPLDLALTHHYRNKVKHSMHLPEPVNNISDSFMHRYKYYLNLQAARFRLRAQQQSL